jgi:hypothetical protein
MAAVAATILWITLFWGVPADAATSSVRAQTYLPEDRSESDRTDSARVEDGDPTIFLALLGPAVCAGLVIRRALVRRRTTGSAQANELCLRATTLRDALSRLMKSVPEGAHWSDEAWAVGEREAEELARRAELLGTKAPRSDRELLFDLVAILRALEVAIGSDATDRSKPSRAEVIGRRLTDLGSAASRIQGGAD